MNCKILFLFLVFSVWGCGGTDLGDGVAIQGSVVAPTPQTDIPVVVATTPASPNLSQQPTVDGTAEPNSEVSIYVDNTCSSLIGAGTADTSGNFAISISQSLPGGTEQSFWVQATAPGELVSECSSTKVSYRTTALRPGLAWLGGNQTLAPSVPDQVNQAIAYPIDWNQSEYDPNYYSHSTTVDSEKISISRAGDYWIAATLPLAMTAGTYRPCVLMEIRINGVLITGGIGQSSYIRFDGPTGNSESSSHVAMLLRNLSPGDEIEVYLSESAGEDGTEVVGISSVASLYLEYVDTARNLFTALATRTVASTNINGGLSSFEWSEGRKDFGFTHDDGSSPQNIILTAGNYLAFVNIPINSNSQRASPRVQLRLNGVVINGGQASQGYIRADSGHNDSSIHWSGYFSANNGDILTVSSQQEAAGGAATVQAGQAGTINIEKISGSSGVIALRASQLAAGVDWNLGGGSVVEWTTSDLHDTTTYTHSTIASPQQIQVNESGDYLVTYNDSMTGSSDRVSPIIKIQVNGSDVIGAETKTHYMRNTSGHNESSASLVFLLRNLSAGDLVTLTSQQDVGAGAVTIIEEALISIVKK